jgi:hypothetical protein
MAIKEKIYPAISMVVWVDLESSIRTGFVTV